MKTLINSRFYLVFLFCFVFLLPDVISQTQTPLRITPLPNLHLPCPLTDINYTVGTSSGSLPVCTYRWTVVGGRITGPTSGTTIAVQWNDESGQGELTVMASSCRNRDENGNTATAKYTRLSIFGQNFPSGACNPSIDVQICSTAPFNVCVNRMFVKETGGINQPPQKEVDRYIWFIPSGFRQTSTTNVGPINVSTTSNSLSLEPLSASTGTVSVRGSIKNSCGQSVSDSNPTSIEIRRTPVMSITTPSGAFTAFCGAIAPVSFSVTALPCATSYTWEIPNNWSGSSTSSSIEVTPNGLNGGTLRVTIGLSTGSSVVVERNIPYSNDPPPALHITAYNNGFQEFCAGESFTYVATMPAGYTPGFGTDWYATDGLLINGSPSSITSPVHSTTNSVTITASPQAFGPKYIHARLNNLSCAPGAYGWSETRVGVYNNNEFSINGPSAVCPNTVADYLSSYIAQDITNYQWSAPNGWSSSGQGTPYFSVSVPPTFSGGDAAITLRLGNRCGLTNTPYVLPLSLGFCGFSATPNPASTTLTVSDLNLNEGETAEATLVDKNNVYVTKGKSNEGKIELDVSGLPNGEYILLVNYKGKSESKKILIRH